ncbi:MAG TPA: hypothetical protein VJB90_02160 [Candidatus Nanoarchaeia archaeon]|nr:hypothetical protein [Candidatus Nanoarchaeia archaeon]
MGYVVTDGKTRHEFETLKDALDFRKDVPLPIFRSDNLGNLKRIPLSELSAAVQQRDFGYTPPQENKEQPNGSHIKASLVLILGLIGFGIALVLLWFVLSEVSK